MIATRLACCLVVACALAAACGKDPEILKREYFAAGTRHVAQRQWREAAIAFQNALRIDPKFAEARVQLADAYLKLDDLAKAVAHYARAADLLPDDADVQLKTGRLLALAGRFDDARMRAELVLKRHPRHVDAQLLLGNALLGLKDLDKAIAEIQEAVQIDPAAAKSYATLGVAQLAKGRKDAAQAAFERAVQIDPKSAGARLALAGFYWAAQDVVRAEQELKRASELEPRNRVPARSLSVLYMATNRAAEAEPYLKRLAEGAGQTDAKLALADYYILLNRHDAATAVLQPLTASRRTRAAARTKLALIAYAARRPVDAHRELDAVLKTEPNHAAALLVKARFLFAEQRIDGALAHVKASVKANPSAAANYFLGTIHAAQYEFDDAAAAFTAVLRLNPRATAAELQLARINLERNRTGAALQQVRNVVKTQPANPMARMVLVDALLATRDVVEAEREMTALLASYPGAAPLHVRAGRLALSKNDVTGGRRAFTRALELEPRSLEALTGMVTVDLAEQRPAEARARVDEQLAKTPDEAGLLMLAARSYVASGDAAKAEAALQRVVTMEPRNLKASSMLGEVYLGQNKLDAAREQFEEVVRRAPDDQRSELTLAMILEAQGRIDAARARYEAILARDPNVAAAANNLAWLYAEYGGDLQRAAELAGRAQRLMPGDPRVADTVGWVYYKQQLPALAAPHFEQSTTRAPSNPLYYFHLGLAYAGAGERDKARDALERALVVQPDFSGADQVRAALASLTP